MHSFKQSALLRQQLLIDRDVQGPILQRTALYSLACAVYFMVILFFTESIDAPEAPWTDTVIRCLDEAAYWAPGLMLLTPIIAYDMLTLTNRFAGPIFRLRRELQRLAAGEESFKLGFRDGDYWMEMAELFNQIRTELLELREARDAGSLGTSSVCVIPAQEKLFDNDDEEEEADEFLLSSEG